jgi:glycosyltransferase involved in cell wall biosynthesis
MSQPKVLFLVEGNTDIRFVTGLSEISDLTMAVPQEAYSSSGLKERVRASGARLQVDEIPGGRLLFQLQSFKYLLRRARDFDVLLCQEVLRGAFNGTLAGLLTKTPVVTYMGISPIEYFRCRRERKQIGPVKALLGETLIRFFLSFNGKFASRSLVMGPYLKIVAQRYSRRVEIGRYYGVDTDLFRPVDDRQRSILRKKHRLPDGQFVIFLSSRISHEKDPETVLRATALARKKGLDAIVLNLGGGYQDFLKLASEMDLDRPEDWVLGRPAAHPMGDLVEYYQAADCLAQASLAEGLGLSPLEALACGTPAICSAVGGLKAHLDPYARLVPRQDAERMCEQFLWIASHPEEARTQAFRGRDYVVNTWSRGQAFSELAAILEKTIEGRTGMAEQPA